MLQVKERKNRIQSIYKPLGPIKTTCLAENLPENGGPYASLPEQIWRSSLGYVTALFILLPTESIGCPITN